ncbi:MAG: septum formation inhibitor Maf [Actinomycetaceae bacterium]|nr:septum formation inhibitor Maf [Actinomycetaceae bacterium]
MSEIPYLPQIPLVLASKSPARLKTLHDAGIRPAIQVSQVDEDEILRDIRALPAGQVLALAAAKARDVATHLDSAQIVEAENSPAPNIPPLVLGCDSMLEIDGKIWGKPHTPEVARERLRAMSGNSGILHTGHYLVNSASFASLSAVSHATVHIAPMSDADIDAYVATGEPLHVAGSFTVDGIGGPFIEEVEGDYHGVVGLSLPLLRTMLEETGLSITQLWTDHCPARGNLSEKGWAFLDPKRRVPRQLADGFLVCACGHQHWGLSGAGGICALRKHEGRVQVLLQLRAPWSHSGGTWAIPGGAVQWNESAFEGAAREFSEESGIDSSLLRPYHPENTALMGIEETGDITYIDSGELIEQRPDLYAKTEATPCVLLDHGDWSYSTFVVSCPDDVEIRPNNESSLLQWFDIEGEPPSPLHPSFARTWFHLRENARHAMSH